MPISRLAEVISLTKQDLAKSFLKAPIVGHVGDGNFHLFILVDNKDPKDLAEGPSPTLCLLLVGSQPIICLFPLLPHPPSAKRINENLVTRAIEMEGTCTGEHGVGVGKRSHLPHELGEEAIELMRQLKATLDPFGILNPGKVLPPRPSRIAKL